jgi:hypothetical protein
MSSERPSKAKHRYLPMMETLYAEKCRAESAVESKLHSGINKVIAAKVSSEAA